MAVSPGSQRHPLPNMRLDAGFWLLNATELLTGCALLGSEVRVAFHVSGDITNWPGTGERVWAALWWRRFSAGNLLLGLFKADRLVGRSEMLCTATPVALGRGRICLRLTFTGLRNEAKQYAGCLPGVCGWSLGRVACIYEVRGVYGPAQRNMAELSNDLVRLGV
ncbi:hypothetical protein TgHK011_004326 [Trichoderma gracile]|nr:hypothetical protein TgHK011_004326 [Trichoderma gracile]